MSGRGRCGTSRCPGAVSALLGLAVLLALGGAPARAVPLTSDENEDHSVNGDGSLKSFFYLLHFPHYGDDLRVAFGVPKGRGGLAAADVRLKLEGEHLDRYKWGLHLRTQPQLSTFAGALETLSFAGGARPPRSLPLQVTAPADGTLVWSHEIDRLFFQVRLGPATLIVGRQPISFGVGFVWMPADLVGTFSPVEFDGEYKPGVDALRVNFALGRFTELALVGAAGGPACGRRTLPGLPTADRLPNGEACHFYTPQFSVHHSVLLARLRTTVGAWDLGLMTGWVRGDIVAGGFFTTTQGRFRIRSEVVYTYDLEEDRPDGDGLLYQGSGGGPDDHFVRAVAGLDYKFDTQRPLIVLAEIYYNGYGRRHARDYLAVAQTPRVAEIGEVFNLGLLYAAVGVSFEPHERVPLALTLMANLLDPSLLASLSVTWKVGDNSQFVAGALLPVGKAPVLDLESPLGIRARSEFGFYPFVYYLQWKLYF